MLMFYFIADLMDRNQNIGRSISWRLKKGGEKRREVRYFGWASVLFLLSLWFHF